MTTLLRLLLRLLRSPQIDGGALISQRLEYRFQSVLRNAQPENYQRTLLDSRRWYTATRTMLSTIPFQMDHVGKLQAYLSLEKFPLGSLDSHAVGDMVLATERFADQATPENVTLAFQLMDRLSQEVKHQNDSSSKKQNETGVVTCSEWCIPNDLPHRIINGWRLCFEDATTTDNILSPRSVFDSIRRWQSCLPALQENNVSYTMIIHAAASCQDPELAEGILHYLLAGDNSNDADDTNNNNNAAILHDFANVITFSSVIDAWAKSGRDDAPMRAEAVLRTMIEYSHAGWTEATPNVVTYSSVITAWANSRHKLAPTRAEELLHEMQSRGLNPETITYSSVLTAWARSKEDRAPHRAFDILKHMVKLYQQGVAKVVPNSYCFSAVVSAYANHGLIQCAEEVLLYQINLCQSTRDRSFRPNRACFNALINAWSKSGKRDAPQLAEAILQHMQNLAESWGDPSLAPDVVSFGSVLSSWAQSSERNAPDRCEAIFQRMQDLFDQGLANSKPNVVALNTVLDCWAKSSRVEAAERAEAILRNMTRPSGVIVKPNGISYNSVLNAWARSSQDNAAQRAQALFDEMDKCRVAELKPNAHTYATLLAAWARSKRQNAAINAQSVFNDMVARYHAGDKDLKPTVVHFTALIDGWAKAGNPARAEAILRQMISDPIVDAKPNIASYSSVMHAWSRSGAAEAAERTQALFDELQSKYKDGDRLMKPDLPLYGTLITAWGRSQSQEGAVKAQAVFDDMVDRYKSGDDALKPSRIEITAVIDSWVKAKRPERAEHILRKMESNVWGVVKPNFITYTLIMNAWAKSIAPDAAEKTQALFDNLMQKYDNGDQDMKPNLQTFVALITAWGRSKRHDGAAKAQRVYDNMVALYEAGDQDLKPNIIIYNCMMDVWAKAGAPGKAEQIFREMDAKPSTISYSILLNAWSRSDHPSADDLMQALYDDLKQKYKSGDTALKPSPAIYGILLSKWSEGRPQMMSRAYSVYQDILSQFNQGETELKFLVNKYNPKFLHQETVS